MSTELSMVSRIIRVSPWDESAEPVGGGGKRLRRLRCPLNPEHIAGKEEGILDVAMRSGQLARDLVWTVDGQLLISETLHRRLSTASVTGYHTMPGILRDSNGKKLPETYHEVLVDGWGGFVLPQSGVELIEFCSGCGRNKWRPLLNVEQVRDPKEWDGSDLFWVWPLPERFVSDRLGGILEDVGLGHWLTELTPYPDCGFTVGGLNDRIPIDKARKIKPEWVFSAESQDAT